MLPPEKIVVLHFGLVEMHRSYMIMVMNEGVSVDASINSKLTQLAVKHFGDRPFGYITHRKNSYSVDPSIYHETSSIDNLVGFAVVSDKDLRLGTAKVESRFLDKPMKVFKDLHSAIEWIEGMIP